eukprot:evm.model.scf_688.3 EVM.evm.TU.scf_688.3   scf_688:14831-16818(+)
MGRPAKRSRRGRWRPAEGDPSAGQWLAEAADASQGNRFESLPPSDLTGAIDPGWVVLAPEVPCAAGMQDTLIALNRAVQAGIGAQGAAGLGAVGQGGSRAAGEGGGREAEEAMMEWAVAAMGRCGVEEARARAALEAVQGCRHEPHRWVNEALCWVCDQHDLNEECRAMGEAMAESLREHQERVEGEVPLAERTPEDLDGVFRDSKVLPSLRALADCPVLFSEPLKGPLVRLLSLEKKCAEHWYPGVGTSQFFERLGRECALCAAKPGGKDAAPSEPCASSSVPEISNRWKRRWGERHEGDGPAGQDGGVGAELQVGGGRAHLIRALGSLLEDKERLVLEAVSSMPLTAGETPEIFKGDVQAADDPGSDIEIIEVEPRRVETAVVAID